jgi:predicted Zn-dependent peptidase
MGLSLLKPETKITHLPNGLKIVTEETFTQTSSVALFIDAGTAYETEDIRGISHLMERMAFKVNKSNVISNIQVYKNPLATVNYPRTRRDGRKRHIIQ